MLNKVEIDNSGNTNSESFNNRASDCEDISHLFTDIKKKNQDILKNSLLTPPSELHYIKEVNDDVDSYINLSQVEEELTVEVSKYISFKEESPG